MNRLKILDHGKYDHEILVTISVEPVRTTLPVAFDVF